MELIHLVVSLFATAFFIVPVLLFSVWLSHKDSYGWSAFWMIVGSVALYKGLGIELTLSNILVFGLLYIGVGIIWSFWRWFRYCAIVAKNFKHNEWKCQTPAEELGEKLALSNNSSRITSWVIAWPASALALIFGDVFDIIKASVEKYIHGFYNRIAAKHIAKLENIE